MGSFPASLFSNLYVLNLIMKLPDEITSTTSPSSENQLGPAYTSAFNFFRHKVSWIPQDTPSFPTLSPHLKESIVTRDLLNEYFTNMELTLPEVITEKSFSLFKEQIVSCYEDTLLKFSPDLKFDALQINLAALLSDSDYIIEGNYKDVEQGHIVKYSNIRSQLSMNEGLTSYMLNPALSLSKYSDYPSLIHGENSEGLYYILFSYGATGKFDKTDGYGVGYNIVTSVETGKQIVSYVNEFPSKVFDIFGTLSSDDRITAPKANSDLIIIPLESIKNTRSETYPNYGLISQDITFLKLNS